MNRRIRALVLIVSAAALSLVSVTSVFANGHWDGMVKLT
jgi:hypothetical protein